MSNSGYSNRRRLSQLSGRERARRHIQAAKALSAELGGVDKDVKAYFFALPPRQLARVLNKYERKYGVLARKYAEKTFPQWKNGRVHMSGMVAERLFNLLPPIMPLEEKYRLTESLWKHVGPTSQKTYYVGLNVDPQDVCQEVQQHMEEVVTHYEIDHAMEARFTWLSQGDVGVKQQLLNHFRQQEKALLSRALRNQLPILMDHLRSENGSFTTHNSQVLKAGKHQVEVIVDKRVDGITTAAPYTSRNKIIDRLIHVAVFLALLLTAILLVLTAMLAPILIFAGYIFS